MKSNRSTEFEKVAHLVPLRSSGDLSVDEIQQVDQAARYDEQTRTTLDEYASLSAILHESAAQPLAGESPIVRGEGSLWDRIEPRLGPVARSPLATNWFERIPVSYMSAACVALALVTLVSEMRKGRIVFNQPVVQQVAATGQSNADRLTTTVATPEQLPGSLKVNIDPKLQAWLLQSTESLVHRESGLAVARINRLLQLQLGLPDMNGVVVAQVGLGSLAEAAGLHAGDCIRSINGQPVYAPQHLAEIIESIRKKGETSLHFDVMRRRENFKQTLELGEQPGKTQSNVLPELIVSPEVEKVSFKSPVVSASEISIGL